MGFHRGVDDIDNDVHTAGVPSAGIGAHRPVLWSHLLIFLPFCGFNGQGLLNKCRH